MDKESILKELEDRSSFKRIKPRHRFPAQVRSKDDKPTIDRIHTAITKLKKQGIKVTSTSIANEIEVSRQRVHEALQHANELHLLPNKARKIKNGLIAIALRDFDTAYLSISEIHQLPIDGLSDISLGALAYILKENRIPHSFNKEERLSTIDTSQYTIKELHEMVGGNFKALREFLYKNKIPHRNKKARQEKVVVKYTLQKLNGLDTSKHSIHELFNLAGDGWEPKAFKKFVYQRKIPHWSDRPRKIDVALKELNIDSSQYTVRQLYDLIGNGRTLNSFSSIIYGRNIPYKIVRSTKSRSQNEDPVRHQSTATLLEKLRDIETQNYAVSRLAAMIGTTYERLSQIVTEHNIPTYKDRRSKDEMAPIWEKLHSIDTTQYTSDELLAFLDNKVAKNVMLKHLAKRGMKYKLLNRKNKNES